MDRFDMNQWAASPHAPSLDALTRRKCFVGFALSSRSAAVELIFPEGEIGIIRHGVCYLTEGVPPDAAMIEREVKLAMVRFDVAGVACDPWESTLLAERLRAAGASVTAVRPGFGTCSDAAWRIAAAMKGQALYHGCGAASLMTLQMSNLVFRQDREGRLRPSPASPGVAITSPVALLFATALLFEWQREQAPEPR